jgi:FtsH-binding integral membrane protein
MHLQSAGLATTVALTSSAVFCVHCLLQQDQAASLHPPLMYACILALLLLPWDVAFKVKSISLYFSF